MIGSILMMSSIFNKNKKLNIISIISWIIFMLIGSNLKTGMMFVLFNLISFGFVILLSKIFKGKIENIILSISSILIWSIVMDILCYAFFPQFVMGQDLITYIFNGIIFNSKFCISNAMILCGIKCIEYILKINHSKINSVEVSN